MRKRNIFIVAVMFFSFCVLLTTEVRAGEVFWLRGCKCWMEVPQFLPIGGSPQTTNRDKPLGVQLRTAAKIGDVLTLERLLSENVSQKVEIGIFLANLAADPIATKPAQAQLTAGVAFGALKDSSDARARSEAVIAIAVMKGQFQRVHVPNKADGVNASSSQKSQHGIPKQQLIYLVDSKNQKSKFLAKTNELGNVIWTNVPNGSYSIVVGNGSQPPPIWVCCYPCGVCNWYEHLDPMLPVVVVGTGGDQANATDKIFRFQEHTVKLTMVSKSFVKTP